MFNISRFRGQAFLQTTEGACNWGQAASVASWEKPSANLSCKWYQQKRRGPAKPGGQVMVFPRAELRRSPRVMDASCWVMTMWRSLSWNTEVQPCLAPYTADCNEQCEEFIKQAPSLVPILQSGNEASAKQALDKSSMLQWRHKSVCLVILLHTHTRAHTHTQTHACTLSLSLSLSPLFSSPLLSSPLSLSLSLSLLSLSLSLFLSLSLCIYLSLSLYLAFPHVVFFRNHIDFDVDSAKSPELPQKSWVWGLGNWSSKSQISSNFQSDLS